MLASPESYSLVEASPRRGDMAPHQNSVPPGARPIRRVFDPWNSSATGHQRAENRFAGSTSWRRSRTLKLANQYGAGPDGGERISDTVGASSRDFGKDGRLENGDWEAGAPGLRESGWQDVRDLLRGEGRQRKDREEHTSGVVDANSTMRIERGKADTAHESKPERRKIFQDLRIYINGSTAPMVSDHRLKQLLAEHGGQISIALGRRSVTHVILGTPNGARGGVQGAGGGLAAGKIQKEIKRVGGCGVKYVGVEW